MRTVGLAVRILVSMWLVTALVGCASGPKSESTGEYVDDSGITTKVKSAFLTEPSLKSMQINVKTYRGVVQLSGFVDSEDQIRRAGEVARGVSGVKDVKNDLTLKK